MMCARVDVFTAEHAFLTACTEQVEVERVTLAAHIC